MRVHISRYFGIAESVIVEYGVQTKKKHELDALQTCSMRTASPMKK